MKIMKLKKSKKKNIFDRAAIGIGKYSNTQAKTIEQMIAVFGEYKVLVIAGFFVQPLLAVCQLFFGFSFIYTFGYLIVYNALLLTYANKQKKRKNDNPEGGRE